MVVDGSDWFTKEDRVCFVYERTVIVCAQGWLAVTG